MPSELIWRKSSIYETIRSGGATVNMPGGGLDPSKIPTGLEGKAWKGGNKQDWVSDHAGTIFLVVAASGFVGLIITFVASAMQD